MRRSVILGTCAQCPESLNVSGLMMNCQKVEGHDFAHVTYEGTEFQDHEAWSKVEARQREEQRIINETIAGHPGQGLTRS